MSFFDDLYNSRKVYCLKQLSLNNWPITTKILVKTLHGIYIFIAKISEHRAYSSYIFIAIISEDIAWQIHFQFRGVLELCIRIRRYPDEFWYPHPHPQYFMRILYILQKKSFHLFICYYISVWNEYQFKFENCVINNITWRSKRNWGRRRCPRINKTMIIIYRLFFDQNYIPCW